MITVVEWGRYEVPKEQSLGWLGGWFNFEETGQRWKDYLEAFHPVAHPYLEAVRESVLEKSLRLTGQDHQQSDEGEPKFSDGKVLSLSYRAWGDLMAAIWSEKENKDYNYMDFYM